MNNKCKYQITLKGFPYSCCNGQKYCPPVLCPNNYLECPVYSQEYNTDTSTHSLSLYDKGMIQSDTPEK